MNRSLNLMLARHEAGLTLLLAEERSGIGEWRIRDIENGEQPTSEEVAILCNTYGFCASLVDTEPLRVWDRSHI